MQIIDALFLKLAGMSLTAGIVILAVLIVRRLIRRLPKVFAYTLWIVVAFRLVSPVSASSDISIFHLFVNGALLNGLNDIPVSTPDKNMDGEPSVSPISATGQGTDNAGGQAGQEHTGFDAGMTMAAPSVSGDTDARVLEDGSGGERLVRFLAYVWLCGIMTLMSYTVAARFRMKRRVRYAIRLYDNVYECDAIRSPFVSGIIFPKIYLPFRLGEAERQCILAHEQYHIKRKDYLIKSAAYVLVIIYWFQPLVWVAYRLMCVDMEMSCDEKIISDFSIDMRKEYSRLLLAFATNKRQSPVSPLAFGEENTMKRIKNILDYKKPAQWKMAGGAVVIALTMAACATDAGAETLTDVSQNSGSNMTNVSETGGANPAAAADSAISVWTTDGQPIVAADSAISVWTTDGQPVEIMIRESHHQEKQPHHSVEEQPHHSVAHHEAQWAANSMFDYEFCTLDYADAEKIVFHISSGLFQYDLQGQEITHSIDLKALNCQEVQTGGQCRVSVYENGAGCLRAVIAPYPYSDAGSYVYDLESDELFGYDASLLDSYALSDSLVSKYDLEDAHHLQKWHTSEHVLPMGEDTYGMLYFGNARLDTLCYKAGDQEWKLFSGDQATLPELSKQDDSFYQSVALHSGKDINQCILDYEAFYNMHDYAGVCALSTGLEYSDAMQEDFGRRGDLLSVGREVSHSEDGMVYVYQFSCSDDYGENGQKVYVNFRYLEDEGWRADGLPTEEKGNE